MQLSKSARYGLYAVLEMAAAAREGRLVTAGAVSRRYGIPEGALAKVLQQLVRAELAVGVRGVGGGYRLVRPAEALTVLDVVRVFERARTPGACLLAEPDAPACPLALACRLRRVFDEVDEVASARLESVTIETLVA